MQFPNITPIALAYFDPGDGRRIAYRYRAASARTSRPSCFCPATHPTWKAPRPTRSTPSARRGDIGCLRFDYSGTGSSGGDFADGTLTRWLQEVLAAIDLLTEGPLIVAGSSMGGWLALHAALRRHGPGEGVARHRRRARFHRLGLYVQDERSRCAATASWSSPIPMGPSPRSPGAASGSRAQRTGCSTIRSTSSFRSGWSMASRTRKCRWACRSS